MYYLQEKKDCYLSDEFAICSSGMSRGSPCGLSKPTHPSTLRSAPSWLYSSQCETLLLCLDLKGLSDFNFFVEREKKSEEKRKNKDGLVIFMSLKKYVNYQVIHGGQICMRALNCRGILIKRRKAWKKA